MITLITGYLRYIREVSRYDTIVNVRVTFRRIPAMREFHLIRYFPDYILLVRAGTDNVV